LKTISNYISATNSSNASSVSRIVVQYSTKQNP